MYIDILIPSIFALFALYTKKVTFPGVVLAWILGIIISIFGGELAFAALATLFLLTISSDKIKKTKKDETRNLYQMISNILTASFCIILFSLTKKDIFYVMYYAVIASSLADTLASSIGTLSKNKPINIFTLEKIDTGESGGVSILGLFASLFGGIIIGAIYLIANFNISNFILISLMGLIGSIFDSVLGIILEAKYECLVCGKIVEYNRHCNKATRLIHGKTFIDNNTVNLLNNIFIFVLSYILLY